MGFFMPKAVAVWLIDNTSLTFEQIAQACSFNTLEIQAIADGEIASNIIGCNPITTGELTKEELHKCEANPKQVLKLLNIVKKPQKKKSYIPIARRKAKPDAIFWLLKYYPSLSYKQIIKLIGTTSTTIESIAKRTHRNMSSINPRDPVLLKLCSKEDLDDEILKAKISNDQEHKYDEARKEELHN
ncbi:MAG: DUF1013 domain-containing protein [Rickettsiaceae bacterium H1]|nr:DUF1013 domain-containing protein [Rickettsiaceae bacterium H1]